MIYKATPLTGPDPKAQRGDFTPSEMVPGQALHYWVEDSRLGEIVYEQTVLERGPNRVVIATRNVTPVKYYLVTLFEPGQLQSVEFLDQLSPGVWGMYALSRTPSSQVGDLLSSGVASLINRAVAVYRRVAGIPTDQEPPAAP